VTPRLLQRSNPHAQALQPAQHRCVYACVCIYSYMCVCVHACVRVCSCMCTGIRVKFTGTALQPTRWRASLYACDCTIHTARPRRLYSAQQVTLASMVKRVIVRSHAIHWDTPHTRGRCSSAVGARSCAHIHFDLLVQGASMSCGWCTLMRSHSL